MPLPIWHFDEMPLPTFQDFVNSFNLLQGKPFSFIQNQLFGLKLTRFNTFSVLNAQTIDFKLINYYQTNSPAIHQQPFGCNCSHITYFGLVIVPRRLILCSKCIPVQNKMSIWSHSIVLKYYIRICDKVASRLRSVAHPWLQARQVPSLGHIFIKLSYQLLDSVAQNTYAINMLLTYIIYNK